jgi:hypothetical protein
MNKNKHVPSSTEKRAEDCWSMRMRTGTIIIRPEDESDTYNVQVDLWLYDSGTKKMEVSIG